MKTKAAAAAAGAPLRLCAHLFLLTLPDGAQGCRENRQQTKNVVAILQEEKRRKWSCHENEEGFLFPEIDVLGGLLNG